MFHLNQHLTTFHPPLPSLHALEYYYLQLKLVVAVLSSLVVLLRFPAFSPLVFSVERSEWRNLMNGCQKSLENKITLTFVKAKVGK